MEAPLLQRQTTFPRLQDGGTRTLETMKRVTRVVMKRRATPRISGRVFTGAHSAFTTFTWVSHTVGQWQTDPCSCSSPYTVNLAFCHKLVRISPGTSCFDIHCALLLQDKELQGLLWNPWCYEERKWWRFEEGIQEVGPQVSPWQELCSRSHRRFQRYEWQQRRKDFFFCEPQWWLYIFCCPLLSIQWQTFKFLVPTTQQS